MRWTWLVCLALVAGCGGPDWARVELADGRVVIARLSDDPPGLDTGAEVLPLGAEDEVLRVEPVSQGEWHLAAGTACLAAGKRTEGLRFLRQALHAPERSVVEVARKKLEAALQAGQVEEAAPTVTAKARPEQPAPAPKPAPPPPPPPAPDPEEERKREEKLRADTGEPPRVPGVSGFDPAGEPPLAELRQFLFGASEPRVLQALGAPSATQKSGDRTVGLQYHAKGLWLHFGAQEQLARITVYLKEDGPWKAYAGRVCGQELHRPTEAQLTQTFPDLRRKFDDARVATWNGYQLEFIIAGAWAGTLELRPIPTPPPAPGGSR